MLRRGGSNLPPVVYAFSASALIQSLTQPKPGAVEGFESFAGSCPVLGSAAAALPYTSYAGRKDPPAEPAGP